MSEESIERLVQFKDYPAVCVGLGKILSREDSQPNPKLRIIADISKKLEPPHFGYLIPGEREISHKIRQQLIDNLDSNREVCCKIINVPENPKGPYLVVGVESPEKEIERYDDMTPEEAFAVIKQGRNIFYAHYLDRKKRELGGILVEGNPSLRFWKNYKEKGFGYLQFTQRVSNSLPIDLKQRKFAENIITFEKINGSATYNKAVVLRKGDRFLARKLGENSEGIFFLELVINFMEEDEAYSPGGSKLVTTVTGHKVGDFIYNLPIISLEKGKKLDDKWIGRSYVPRPEEEREKVLFFYKTVLVFELTPNDFGQYVDARITKKNENLIYAEKII